MVWAKIALMEKDNISIEWLSTHPSHERRQAQLEELLPIGLEARTKCQVNITFFAHKLQMDKFYWK